MASRFSSAPKLRRGTSMAARSSWWSPGRNRRQRCGSSAFGLAAQRDFAKSVLAVPVVAGWVELRVGRGIYRDAPRRGLAITALAFPRVAIIVQIRIDRNGDLFAVVHHPAETVIACPVIS